MATIEITARVKAFACEPMQSYRLLVDLTASTISVWDSVAGHYTTCHSIGAASAQRVLRLAMAEQGVVTARAALQIAREKANKAARQGQIYSEQFRLANGRTLCVGHAPATGGGQLFGAWVYWYQDEEQTGPRQRPLSL